VDYVKSCTTCARSKEKIQVSQAILEESPDLRLVASKWRWLIHAVFFGLIGHNLRLCHRDSCHNRSDGVWFDIEGYRGLLVFENKRLVRMRLCLFSWVSFCVKRGRKFWFVLFIGVPPNNEFFSLSDSLGPRHKPYGLLHQLPIPLHS
jgi:hypothetical protein